MSTLTKNEYISDMQNQIPYLVLYNYWIDNKPANYKELNFDEFKGLFEAFLGSHINMVETPTGPKVVNFRHIIAKITNYYNEKFKE